jgi:hypothetical protein
MDNSSELTPSNDSPVVLPSIRAQLEDVTDKGKRKALAMHHLEDLQYLKSRLPDYP